MESSKFCSEEHKDSIIGICNECKLFFCENCLYSNHYEHSNREFMDVLFFQQYNIWREKESESLHLKKFIENKISTECNVDSYQANLTQQIDNEFTKILKIVEEHKQKIEKQMKEILQSIIELKNYWTDLLTTITKINNHFSNVKKKFQKAAQNNSYQDYFLISQDNSQYDEEFQINSALIKRIPKHNYKQEFEKNKVISNLNRMNLDQVILLNSHSKLTKLWNQEITEQKPHFNLCFSKKQIFKSEKNAINSDKQIKNTASPLQNCSICNQLKETYQMFSCPHNITCIDCLKKKAMTFAGDGLPLKCMQCKNYLNYEYVYNLYMSMPDSPSKAQFENWIKSNFSFENLCPRNCQKALIRGKHGQYWCSGCKQIIDS